MSGSWKSAGQSAHLSSGQWAIQSYWNKVGSVRARHPTSPFGVNARNWAIHMGGKYTHAQQGREMTGQSWPSAEESQGCSVRLNYMPRELQRTSWEDVGVPLLWADHNQLSWLSQHTPESGVQLLERKLLCWEPTFPGKRRTQRSFQRCK